MANTLTSIIPEIYAALDIVSREIVGMIPAMQRSTDMARAAVGQTVTVPVVPAATTGNITPASIPPDDGDQVVSSRPLTITKSVYSPVRWNGEEQRALGPTGMYNAILANQFAQSMRALVNQIESDAAVAGYRAASRAYGTAGTAPFGTAGDLTDFAGVNRILDENGAPQAGRRLVVNFASRFNLEGKQTLLLKANEAGTDDLLRRRIMAQVMNFGLGFSPGLGLVTSGTSSGHLVNNVAGYDPGDTTIAVDTGTGTILAGDVVTFAGDPNKYVVATALAGGQIVLNEPGLRLPLADGTALTVGDDYSANVAFTPDALILAARAPAIPAQGDSADDSMIVVDDVSGLPFEIRLYREYRRVRYEVSMAWGVGVVKPAHIAALIG